MARAFIIRPFGTKKDSGGAEIDFDRVDRELIRPALEAVNLGGGTTGEIVDAGNIREDMFGLIFEADVVVCDITILNANVFYELGIRHALRKRSTVMIKGQPTKDGTPFDLLTDRYLPYDIGNPGASMGKLIATLNASMNSARETDSPIFQMLPSLPEVDPSRVRTVPVDFREEVNRARAAKSKGWLRLLSEEVCNQRFQWGGLKLVATAQWDLKDWEGARESWETIIETHPDDIDANLALANIYERLHRVEPMPKLMEASDQAIKRVLDCKEASQKQRVEALSLGGRNQKTRWRHSFDQLMTTGERRAAAMNRELVRSYEEYRKAFNQDLNHFYSGLAALQMGTILLDLSKEKTWFDAFDSDSDADSYKRRLEGEVGTLQCLVPASVGAELQRMSHDDPNRFWAEISAADVLFLTPEGREQRVLAAYADAIPPDKPFAWDAARGQLELFAALGVKADLAGKVINKLSDIFKEEDLEQNKPQEKPKKPVHLIVLAGHLVDAPDRSEPRFPLTREAQAKALIRETVEGLRNDEYEFMGLASAAPGADILAHEVCSELKMKSTICLPMPAKDYARLAFEELDNWRTRFLDLQQDHHVIELSDREGLPRWLSGSNVDSWERGNRWVMQMALTWGAKRITLVALWDGKMKGDAPGGTAQMVQLARDAGTVRLEIVDAKRLLA
jgi:tetratricopeptide (TPR) repeat protein